MMIYEYLNDLKIVCLNISIESFSMIHPYKN